MLTVLMPLCVILNTISKVSASQRILLSEAKRIEANVRKYKDIYIIAGEILNIPEDATQYFNSFHCEICQIYEI